MAGENVIRYLDGAGGQGTSQEYALFRVFQSNPLSQLAIQIAKTLFSNSETWAEVNHDNLTQIQGAAIACLAATELLEVEVSGRYEPANTNRKAYVDIRLTYTGDMAKVQELHTIRERFAEMLSKQKAIPQGGDMESIANNFRIKKTRLTPHGVQAQALIDHDFNHSKDEDGNWIGPTQLSRMLFEIADQGNSVLCGNPKLPISGRGKVLQCDFSIEGDGKAEGSQKRLTSNEVEKLVIAACKTAISSPGISKTDLEKMHGLAARTLSKSPHKEIFEKARETGTVQKKKGTVEKNEDKNIDWGERLRDANQRKKELDDRLDGDQRTN